MERNEIRAMLCLIVLFATQILLIVLKGTGAVDMVWWVAFIPSIIFGGLALLTFLVATILIIIEEDFHNRR